MFKSDSPERKQPSNFSKEACFDDGGPMFDPTDLQEINDAVVHIQSSANYFATEIYIKVPKLKRNCILTCEHVEIRPGTNITFLYQRDKKPLKLSLESSIKLLGTDPWTYDFQLLSVSEDNLNAIHKRNIKPVLLQKPSSDPQKGDIVRVIQHPQGREKRHSEKNVSFVKDYYFGYNAQTLAGSSGGAIVLRNELVGLHQESNNKKMVNQGTLISKIVDVVDEAIFTCPNPDCPVAIATYERKHSILFQDDIMITCSHCGLIQRGKEGMFKSGKLCGFGTQLTVEDGAPASNEGLFHNGKFHGRGKYQSAGGVVYSGNWMYGRPSGECDVTVANGRVRCLWDFVEKTERSECTVVLTGWVYEGHWTFWAGGKVMVRNGRGVLAGAFVNGYCYLVERGREW